MIISDEQVRRALDYLRTTVADGAKPTPHEVPDDLIARVRAELLELPDVRADRVREAVDRMQGDGPSAADVAEKIIARTITDSLR